MIQRHTELSVPLPGRGFLTFRFNLTQKDEELHLTVEDAPDYEAIKFNELRDLIDDLKRVADQINSDWCSGQPKKVKRIEHRGKETTVITGWGPESERRP